MKPAPPPPGHPATRTAPASIGRVAAIAHDPSQPRHVRAWHSEVLRYTLEELAAKVTTVTRPA